MASSFGPLLLTSLFLASLGFGSTQHASRHSIHESMSTSDLRSVFHVESHEQVPEYDVVHLQIVKQPNKRSADQPVHKRVNLQAFGQKMQLLLEPNIEFNRRLESLKMYSAESRDSGKRIKYSEEAIPDAVGTSYHDDSKMAAVVIRHSANGNILMDGTIGNDLVIKPVPSTVTLPNNNRDDDEMFLEDADDVSVVDLVHLKKKSSSTSPSSPSTSASTTVHSTSTASATAAAAASESATSPARHLNYTVRSRSGNYDQETEVDSTGNINIPKVTSIVSSSSSSSSGKRPKSNMYKKHAHFVFKKKFHLKEEPHSDYASLEPGHLTSLLNASAWKLDNFNSSSNNEYIFNNNNNYNINNNYNSNFNGNSDHNSRYNSSTSDTSSSSSSSSSNTSHRRSKRQSPDTVWPEVLLVVDYDSYLLHGGNSRDVKRYFISFWNGVDLRYKLLSHPRIRVSLAGMIVAKDRDATPYLERNRLRTPNADAVDAAGALTDMGKYLYREDRLPTYDLAVVITKLDMCRRRYEGGRCNRGTAGFAYVGGACVVNKRLEKVNSVAIIEDSGGFSGIIVAAHEVGHLLGCVHDGSPPPSYLGGPGATRCPWEDGFIMSDLRHTERGFRWSSCSVEQFKHFLNGETATCLYNYPHENQLLPRVLPGTMLTLDEQCKRDRGTNACFKDARVCAQLFCFDSASGYCVSYRPAAEGSSCGDGQVCRNGKCTAELENIIPDYTHVTQTVVTRGSDDVNSPSQASCRDKNEQLAGLSCADFLKLYGYRYCNHAYIKRNCCASHGIICNNKL